jgi:hypothetical protein
MTQPPPEQGPHGPYQPPPQGSWAVPPNPQQPWRPQRKPVKGGRIVAGLVIAIAGHLLTLVVVALGVAAENGDVAIAGIYIGLGGQLLVFLACLAVGITLTVRQDGGIGIGLLIGWAVGVLIVPVVGFGLCVAAFESSSL